MSDNEIKDKRPDLSILRRDAEDFAPPRRRPWIGWLITALVLAAAVFWLFDRKPLPIFWPEVETTSVRQVTSTQKSTVLTASGYTYAVKRAAVGAKIIGRILELPVDEGDVLKKGDLIAVLDSDNLKADVASAEAALLERQADLGDARRERGRQQQLVDSGIGTQAALDAATTRIALIEAQIQAAEARLRAARSQLAYTRIFAPIDGVVIERNVEVGEMVAPGGFTSQQSTGAILRLADPKSLEIEADVNESYISRLRRGQPATIVVDAVPDKTYRGQLRQIVPTADRQRAVVQVKVTIDDRDERLVPDMSATVTFLEEGTAAEALQDVPPTLYLAERAVVEKDGMTKVWVRQGEVLAERTVTFGAKEGQDRVVITGLNAGQEVIVPGSEKLVVGQKVRVKKP
jgi:HlyD family secretion protein